MKKVLSVLVLCFGLLPAAMAQKSLLYKITGKKMQQPSYILGTIWGCDGDNMLDSPTVKIFNHCEQLLIEANTSDSSEVKKSQKISYHPQGLTLDKVLSKDEYAKVAAFFKEQGIPMEYVNPYSPNSNYGLATLLLIPCEQPNSCQSQLVEMASTAKKKIKPLETVDQLQSSLNAVPQQSFVKILMKLVNNPEAQILRHRRTDEYYLARDLDGLGEMLDFFEDADKYLEIMIDKRNRRMFEVIKHNMGEKRTFIATSSIHLPGPTGIIAQLKAAGYTVTPEL